MSLELNSNAINFDLKGVDGKSYSLNDFEGARSPL